MSNHDDTLSGNRREWESARKGFALAIAYHALECSDSCCLPDSEETLPFIERMMDLVYGLGQLHAIRIHEARLAREADAKGAEEEN